MNKSWLLPQLLSITVHPADRANLTEQLPLARVFGEPIPAAVAILESTGLTLGTLRLQFDDGSDIPCTLGPPVGPQRWIRCDPFTGIPMPLGPAAPTTP